MIGISPYLFLMRRHGLYPQSTAMSMSFSGGVEPPDSMSTEYEPGWAKAPSGPPNTSTAPYLDDRRSAKMHGLTAAGLSLLANAGRGDFGGSLAQALGAFQEGRQSDIDRQRAEFERRRRDEREVTAEERAAAAEKRQIVRDADLHRGSEVSIETETARLAGLKDEQERGKRLREATGKSASVMVDDINAIAGQHPDDPVLSSMAKRAVGYALGDESDLNRLAGLHADMVARANRGAEEQHEIDTRLRMANAEARAGYGPIVESRRAGERLGLERQEIADRRERYTGAGSAGIKPSAWYDDVNHEIDAIVTPILRERERRVKDHPVDDAALASPEFRKRQEQAMREGRTIEMPRVQPYSEAEIAEIRSRAERQAVENVNRRYSQYGGTGSGGSGGTSTGATGSRLRQVAPGEYHYDPRADREHHDSDSGSGSSTHHRNQLDLSGLRRSDGREPLVIPPAAKPLRLADDSTPGTVDAIVPPIASALAGSPDVVAKIDAARRNRTISPDIEYAPSFMAHAAERARIDNQPTNDFYTERLDRTEAADPTIAERLYAIEQVTGPLNGVYRAQVADALSRGQSVDDLIREMIDMRRRAIGR